MSSKIGASCCFYCILFCAIVVQFPNRTLLIKIKSNIQITKSSTLKIDSIKLYPDEPISKGYSGSPVICRNTNKVIGVVNIQVGSDTNYAISVKHLISLHGKKIDPSVVCRSILSTKKGLTTEISSDEFSIISKRFDEALEASLQSFSTQQNVWIEPRIHTKDEGTSVRTDKEEMVSIDNIIDNPESSVVQARQQFGLTCLAHHLVKEAWARPKPSLWLYIDVNDLKPYAAQIRKHIAKKLKILGLSIEDVECIILDEVSSNIVNVSQNIRELCDVFVDLPIIVMMTITDNPLLNELIEFPESKTFTSLHLWALPRNDVRKFVSDYNSVQYVGDENTIVSKVISDLDVLNIPRTALNCLTILKVYELNFEDNPVNRTEMIKQVLFILFNIDEIPQYKSRPDLKDTEYILGYFCEKLLKENRYYFSREYFLGELDSFCEKCEIDIETHVIFDVLYKNNIIVMRGSEFCFKFTYWIFYFAAHRMHHCVSRQLTCPV